MGPVTYLQHINHNMSILGVIIGIIAPYECLVCNLEGKLLCNGCTQELPTVQALACAGALQTAQAATLYQGAAKDLLWALKSSGAQAAAKTITSQIIKRTKLKETLIVPVPTATSRVRQRGYDQAKLIARELSRQARLPYLDCLVRVGQTHQVGASREQRLNQLKSSFYIKKPRSIKGRHITLVDDVITTGATVEAAASILKNSGALSISALTFAYAEPRAK